MRFRPLRADGRGQLLGRGLVALCGRESRVQRLQHFAVGFVLDACGQRSGLYRSAVQNAFDGHCIGFATERSANLLCDSGTGVGVLQRVLFLPLRADGRGKRFCRRFVTTGSTNTGAQGLQHFAVGFVFDACGQRSGLYRGAVQDAFDSRHIGFATEGSADLLCDSGTGVGVLQ